MRKLTGIETATVRLANEIGETLESTQDTNKISFVEDIQNKLNYLKGYADAIKAFIEVEAENRGVPITANNDGFVITCNGTANEATQ